MSITLDDLKAKLEAAQKRLAEAKAKLEYAQQVNNYAQYEVNTWTAAVNIQNNLEEQQKKEAAIAAPAGAVGQTAASPATSETKPTTQTIGSGSSENTSQEVNKTEAIRELLRQHPAGLTPADLWKNVKDKISHRPYLYSVLKRLKDRDEVTIRRGKYLLKSTPKVEEQKAQPSVVQ
jgi:hypothetical protein